MLKWFKKYQPDVKLTPDESYFDADAIDSLGIIELIEDLESTFSVKFTQADFQDRRFASITGLASILKEKTQSCAQMAMGYPIHSFNCCYHHALHIQGRISNYGLLVAFLRSFLLHHGILLLHIHKKRKY